MLVRAPPVLAPFRCSHTSSTSDTKSVQIPIADHNHGPAPSTVPTVRAAHGHVLFPPETQTAVAAVAAADVQSSFIPESELFGAPSPVALLLVEECGVLLYVVSRRARRRR